MQTGIARYGARHWAVYHNGQLLAVTVYKKGALAVHNALESYGRLDGGVPIQRKFGIDSRVRRVTDVTEIVPFRSRGLLDKL
jgi:hypothetical protein